MQIYPDTPTKELFAHGLISTRTYNCLRYAGMVTIGDVLRYADTPTKLLNLKNFGRKSLDEMLPLMREVISENPFYGLTPAGTDFDTMDDGTCMMLREAYAGVVAGGGSAMRHFCARYPGVEQLHNCIMGGARNLLEADGRLTMDENVALRRATAHYSAEAISRMTNGGNANSCTCRDYEAALQDLTHRMEEFSYKDRVAYFTSSDIRRLMQSVYMQMVSNDLSARARNFVMARAPRFENMVPMIGVPLEGWRDMYSGSKNSKTHEELYRLSNKLRDHLDRLWAIDDFELQQELLRNDCPTLGEDEVLTAAKHWKLHGSLPLFYLLYHYMRQSEVRSNKIYAMLYGIADGKRHTMGEAADMMGLTRERIRQIVTSRLEVHETLLVTHAEWERYHHLLDLPFVTAETEEYLKLRHREHLEEFDFGVFARLLQLVGPFETETAGDIAVAINREKMPTFKMSVCLDSLKALVAEHRTSDTRVEIECYQDKMADDEKSEVCRLMMYLARANFGLVAVGERELLFKRNRIDAADELYNMLRQKGTPMSLDEMFVEFKKKYPRHRYATPTMLRPYLYQHPHIRPIGNTSRYGLDTWEDVFYGTIRDHLAEQLERADTPLHINHLLEELKKHYPNTNVKSVESTMAGSPDRFVRFSGGRFGLKTKTYDKETGKHRIVRAHYSFDSRFVCFCSFVETNHRYPLFQGDNYEAALARWIYNVQRGSLKTTVEQRQMVADKLKAYEQECYPRNAMENECRNKCCEYMAFVKTHGSLPTASTQPGLHEWRKRVLAACSSYKDHRQKYLADLQEFIDSQRLGC